MRNRRVLLGIVVAILLAAISLGRAGAQGYGSADGCANAVCTFKPGVTLTMAAGDLKTIVIDLDGFAPLSDVTVTLRSDPVVLGTFKSDAQGRVRATVTLPSNVTIGNHSLTVAGLDPAGRAYAVTSPLVVAAPATTTTATTSPSGSGSGSTTSGGFLARTGRAIGSVAIVGVVQLGGGAAVTIIARRRQRDS